MQILLLGSDNFAGSLTDLGHEVITAGPGPSAGLPMGDQDPDLARTLASARKLGLSPDAVLVCDNVGRRQVCTGVWQSPLPTAFFGVDAPLNSFWMPDYASLFDLALLDQPGEAQRLAARHVGAHWLPLAVEFDLYQGEVPSQKKPGVCFVGVRNDSVRPKRSAVLQQVGALSPLEVRGGRRDQWLDTLQAADLYRSFQVALNENLFPGMTTRPLEIMASGGCLLSEATGGIMESFFTHGEHLLYFGPGDLRDNLQRLLGDADLRRKLSENGREAVRQAHTMTHRARRIVELLEAACRAGQERRARAAGADALTAEGKALLMTGLRWPGQDSRRRLLQASSRLREAASRGGDMLRLSGLLALAHLALGRTDQALQQLAVACELGGETQRLRLGLALHAAGGAARARETLRGLTARYPGLALEPDQARFHLDAARLLQACGHELTPGFDRSRLHPVAWSSFEHLLKAIHVDPSLSEAWEMAGDALAGRNAPTEAHYCYDRAVCAGAGNTVAEKRAIAASKGYMC